MAHPAAAQVQALSPTTTGVMVIITVKAGVTREQVMAVMPAEIRQTVQLYLEGKIREWYSRATGRGAVLFLDTRDVAEAHTLNGGPAVPSKTSWTTNTSPSVRFFRSACTSAIPERRPWGRASLGTAPMTTDTVAPLSSRRARVAQLLWTVPFHGAVDVVESTRCHALPESASGLWPFG